MWTTRLIQRSVRLCRSPMPWSNVQSWPKVFSTSTFSLKEEERRRRNFYPDDRIKSMEDFERLATPEEKKHMERIQAEFYQLCSRGDFQDIDLTEKQWLQHMNYETKATRIRHLKRILRKAVDQVKKGLEGQKEPKPIVYSETRRFFRDIFNFTENQIIQNRLAQAMMLEDPIFMDLGFADDLDYDEIEDVVNQLMITFGLIKESAISAESTLNVIFCNATPSPEENLIIRRLMKNVPDLTVRDLLVTVTEKSYLDLYPKKDLVYLSPDAKDYYHPDDGIPIIGAIVDRRTTTKLSYSKGHSHRLKLRRLPIDLLDTIYGNKSLALNHVVDYIHRLQITWDPEQAKEALPKRKFKQKFPGKRK